MSAKTGWIKYKITGNGCSDKWTYIYAPDYCGDDIGKDAVPDYIMETHESWLEHAYHFHRIIWKVNVFPPMKDVHMMIRQNEYYIKKLRKQNKELQKLFEILID